MTNISVRTESRNETFSFKTSAVEKLIIDFVISIDADNASEWLRDMALASAKYQLKSIPPATDEPRLERYTFKTTKSEQKSIKDIIHADGGNSHAWLRDMAIRAAKNRLRHITPATIEARAVRQRQRIEQEKREALDTLRHVRQLLD